MHDEHLRRKAIELRGRGMSIDEIAERLALPRTTIYSWVKGLPLGRPRRWSQGQRKGNEAMRRKYAAKREAAYAGGLECFDLLSREPLFRDFVCLYLAEGTKRTRGEVAICNSDPAVIDLSLPFFRRFSRRPVRFSVQVHADQDLEAIQAFWAQRVGVEPEEIRLQRKSNSGQLSGRTWRSVYGVLTVRTGDTCFRARLEAWMDQLRASWA